jgi:predicted nucleotidyltransferase/HEPN domain-containing protein
MRRDLEHVPERQREELARATAILQAGFEEATALSTSAWKKSGRILRIVLFGSYARGDWVDDKVSGYQSDFDLLVVVNDKRLTDVAEFWHAAEDKLIADPAIARPVNFIVHSLEEVNAELARGQYFFTDIVKEGVVLFEASGAKAFKTPVPQSPAEALATAERQFKSWFESVPAFVRGYRYALNDGDNRKAVFDLHQAVERLYACLLVTLTGYSPATHNIKLLRSLAEDLEPELRAAWPRDTREARRRFELLKRAYVEARYSEHYAITDDDLAWLGERAEALIRAVEAACAARIKALKIET